MKYCAIILLIIANAVCSCTQAPKGSADTQHKLAAKKCITKTDTLKTAMAAHEKLLDSLAQKMVQSADSYTETGSTAAQDQFVVQLVKALSDVRTVGYNFPSLKKYDIDLLVSADKRLKIYSWRSPYSGSMWQTQNILQYRVNDHQVLAAPFNSLYEQQDDEAPTPVFDKVYKVDNAMYLLTGYGQMSGTEPYSVAHMLVIEHDHFSINKKIFRINGKPDNEIYVSASLSGDQDIDSVRASLKINYDSTARSIQYPQTKEVGSRIIVTGKKKVLQFTNGVFK